jgi:glutathione synthase/RimK-type ligase-like ATP-grasp enzyme
MRIGIVGAENETHSANMKEVLRRKGVDALIIDTIKFPDEATLSVFPEKITYQAKPINDINVYYVRSVFYSHPPYDLEDRKTETKVDMTNWYVEYTAERERQSHLTSWLSILSLEGKSVVNPIESFNLHYLKNYQIHILKKSGIPVPATLVTNDGKDLMEFVKKHKSVVYKPVAGGAACKRLGKADLSKERLNRLKSAPVLFQEEIVGDNIRVYVIDKEVVSSNIIYTDALDFRGNEKAFERVDLPGNVKKMCVKAVALCGMKFSGIDLKRDLKDNYVMLECNPSAMDIGMVQATGDPIDRFLADYLIKTARTFK